MATQSKESQLPFRALVGEVAAVLCLCCIVWALWDFLHLRGDSIIHVTPERLHPADDTGKHHLQQVYTKATDPAFGGRVAFVVTTLSGPVSSPDTTRLTDPTGVPSKNVALDV